MDKLRGVDSLPVVLNRFSNGVEVVRCIVDFCNEVAILEKSYSESLHRLLRSSSYTFHSNLLFQWLGNSSYEEIGSLKHSWQELGHELSKLAELHSEQKHQDRELNRVNTLKESLIEFSKVLSNTAPAYLEGMQKIKMSVSRIDAVSDVQCFIDEHAPLQTTTTLPSLEKHSFVRSSNSEEPYDRDSGRQSPIGGADDTSNETTSHEKGKTGSEPVTREPCDDARGNTKPARKWPLEGFWGGIRGRRKQTEQDGRREDDDDGCDKQSTVEDSGGVREKEGEGGKALGEERGDGDSEPEQKDSNSHTHHHTSHTVSMAIHTFERSAERSAVHQQQQRNRLVASSNNVTNSNRDKSVIRRDGTRPTPNPKPLSLVSKSEEFASHSSNETSVHNDSVKSGDHRGNSGNQETIKPTKTRPPKAAKPKIESTKQRHHDQFTTTQTEISPRNKRVIRSGESEHPPQQSTTTSTHNQRTRRLTTPPSSVLSSNVSASRGRSHVSSSISTKPPLLSPSPPPPLDGTTDTIGDDIPVNIYHMVSRLQQQACDNDYYRLFGVDAMATGDELARVRREMSKQLHPDHFVKQPEKQERAQQRLMMINQVFQDVLKDYDTRTLYDQLCQFRQHYGRVPYQRQRGLQVAQSKLESLHKQLKKNRAPLSLLSEIQNALDLINLCQHRHKH